MKVGQRVVYRQIGDKRRRRALVLSVQGEHVTVKWRGSWRVETCLAYWLEEDK